MISLIEGVDAVVFGAAVFLREFQSSPIVWWESKLGSIEKEEIILFKLK